MPRAPPLTNATLPASRSLIVSPSRLRFGRPYARRFVVWRGFHRLSGHRPARDKGDDHHVSERTPAPRHSAQLRADLDLADLDTATLAAELGLSTAAVEEALDVGPATHPALVWRLRDHLESAVRAAGAEPHEYTYLPERMRSAAQVWFGVGDHRFSD
ncbi:DUF2316 family protein [Gordonia sputi]